MKLTRKTITEAIDGGYFDFAMYVLEERSIPSAIDGLKSVTRKLIYAMLNEHYGRKTKLADLGGISKYNYGHGEDSAIKAAIGMSQKWNNNVPLFEQHGNFGSRLVQEAGGPRYIHASMSENFKTFFADSEVAPPAFDKKNPEPAYYLPIIPWVLVNGVGGMAIGFKTEILPRAVKDVLEATKECLKNREKFLKDNKPIPPKFPNFTGEVVQKNARQWKTRGTVNFIGRNTFDITELPVGYDRANYVTILHDLRERGLIKDFEDGCSKTGFGFKIKVTLAQKADIDKDPIKYLKLEKTHTEFLVTMGTDGKLKLFRNVAELIAYFCDFRTIKFEHKIEYDKDKLRQEIKILSDKKKFIKDVVLNKVDFRKSTKADLLQYVVDNVTPEEYGKGFIKIPLYECTPEEVNNLITTIEGLKTDLLALDEINGISLFNKRLKALKL